MPNIEDWEDYQVKRLCDEVMAQHPFKESPHSRKSHEDLVLELDSADEVMTEMSAAIDRLHLSRYGWRLLAVAGWIALAVTNWRWIVGWIWS